MYHEQALESKYEKQGSTGEEGSYFPNCQKSGILIFILILILSKKSD
jgi:hypothetical protein